MNVILVEDHDGEGVFPVYKKGTLLESVESCDESEHWLSCIIDNRQIYVPDSYIDAQSRLTRDYNPTELIAKKDEVAEVLKIVHEWLYVKNQLGGFGWLPASKTISISE